MNMVDFRPAERIDCLAVLTHPKNMSHLNSTTHPKYGLFNNNTKTEPPKKAVFRPRVDQVILQYPSSRDLWWNRSSIICSIIIMIYCIMIIMEKWWNKWYYNDYIMEHYNPLWPWLLWWSSKLWSPKSHRSWNPGESDTHSVSAPLSVSITTGDSRNGG